MLDHVKLSENLAVRAKFDEIKTAKASWLGDDHVQWGGPMTNEYRKFRHSASIDRHCSNQGLIII